MLYTDMFNYIFYLVLPPVIISIPIITKIIIWGNLLASRRFLLLSLHSRLRTYVQKNVNHLEHEY